MNRIEAPTRLQAHANLPGGDYSARTVIADVLRAWKNAGGEIQLLPQTAEVIECLQVFNDEVLAGRDGVPFETPVEREPAYSVSCILCDLARAQARATRTTDTDAKDAISECLIAITHVWSQFLAGDITTWRPICS